MPRFSTTNSKKSDYIRSKGKSDNTNKATKLWLQCFMDYLLEKQLPAIDKITTPELPFILEQFYSDVRKKEAQANPPHEQAVNEEDDDSRLYKNTTLKAIRAALTCYFKTNLSINIVSNESFIKANEIFEGVQHINKQKGKGNIVSKPPIDDTDLVKITTYFKDAMNGPANPTILQEIVLFYTVFYMCRRGRENLRSMKKNTFAIATDPDDGRSYIYQAIDEADKNHNHNDTHKSNDGRIYAVPGMQTFSSLNKMKHQFYHAKLNSCTCTHNSKLVFILQVHPFAQSRVSNSTSPSFTQRTTISGNAQRRICQVFSPIGMKTHQLAKTLWITL